MADDPFADWYVDEVHVETLVSVAVDGAETYEPHSGVFGMMEARRTHVIDSSGQEVTVSGSLHLPIDVPAAWFAPGSKILWRGWTYTAVTVDTFDADPDLAGTTVTLR